MVLKKEGAIMTCKQCGTDLICQTKDYGGNYPPALQWQNNDGTAHYKTEDGKNYKCMVPEDESGPVHATADAPGQTQIARVVRNTPSNLSHIELSMLSQLNEKLDHAIDPEPEECWFEVKAGVIDGDKLDDIHLVQFCYDNAK